MSMVCVSLSLTAVYTHISLSCPPPVIRGISGKAKFIVSERESSVEVMMTTSMRLDVS